MLPEMMFREACDVPPMVLSSAFSIATPAEFPNAFLPAASVPMTISLDQIAGDAARAAAGAAVEQYADAHAVVGDDVAGA